MAEWTILPGSPNNFILASDARLVETSYTNDQIWKFETERGEPQGLSVQTTYGLRAKSMRVLPRFIQGEKETSSPGEFASPIIVETYYPNYLALTFSLDKDILVNLAYWVPNSQVLSIKTEIINNSTVQKYLKVEWISLLVPDHDGSRMSIIKDDNIVALGGKTGNLAPVFFIGGGAEPTNGSFPGLVKQIEVNPNQKAGFFASLASKRTLEESITEACLIVGLDWEAAAARIRMVNEDCVQVLTGNADWNRSIQFSQAVGAGLLMSATQNLPNISFVSSRNPDSGYSERGDGSDYNITRNGQTVFQARFLLDVLPTFTEIGKGLLDNFFTTQEESGFIDWKPGLAGQRSKLNATPVLATLTWQMFELTEDLEFLRRFQNHLDQFIEYWFTPLNDTDKDGIPEWQHVFQSSIEENLLFTHWLEDSLGIDIKVFECPDLCSLLYAECDSLMKISNKTGQHTEADHMARIAHIVQAFDTFWSPATSIAHYRDRDSHSCLASQVLAYQEQSADLLVQRDFTEAVRLHIEFHRSNFSNKRFTVFIHGTRQSGDHRIERINGDNFSWQLEKGFATSEITFIQIDKIRVEGLLDEDRFTIRTLDYNWFDCSLLLPLWAGLFSNTRATQVIENILLNPEHFWRPYGVPIYPKSNPTPRNEVQISFNTFLVDSLLRYGYRNEAAELMTRLLNTISNQVKREGHFRQKYDPENGLGSGEVNSLEGLVPLKTFLDTLGVKIYTPWKIKISGFNPFPWPVTVKYRGTSILRKLDQTDIVFPDGQNINVDNNKTHLIIIDN